MRNMGDYITKSMAGMKVWENTIRLVPVELEMLAHSGDKWANEEIERIRQHNERLLTNQ